jgi:hypothetical protein
MSNLYAASHQWATRPDDERYESLQAMYDATKKYAHSSIQAKAPLSDLRVEAAGTDLRLIGKTGTAANLTHYSFGQLSRFAKAPAEYLRALPATLAAQNLNHGLKAEGKERDDSLRLLFHSNGSLVTRAIVTENYDRVWNYQLVGKIMERLTPAGWVVPPARPVRAGQKGTRKATAADILPNQKEFGLAVKEGDDIAPAGLYASDHDMFAFLVNQIDPIWDGAKFLNRGVFIQNSEVGDCSLRFKLFTYDNVCGNHIVWGVGKVAEIAVRHIKGGDEVAGRTMMNAMNKWNIMAKELPSASVISNNITAAKGFEIAAKKEDVLDAVFKFAKVKGLSRLTRDTIESGYEVAEKTPRYGAPTTVWGLVNGLTEHSQTSTHADVRNELDVQAGRLMEMAF